MSIILVNIWEILGPDVPESKAITHLRVVPRTEILQITESLDEIHC